MNPAAIFPSLTSTDGRPVCRFCLDGDESVSRLIKPCKCRGTVALVHPNCLEMWVQTSHKLVCQMCQIAYEQESGGLNNISEWTWPRPLGESETDKADFRFMICWIAYVLLLGFSFTMFGFSGMLQWIDAHYMILYCANFILFADSTAKSSKNIAKIWIGQNTIFKYKDISTEAERRVLDEVELQPRRCTYCPEDTENISPLIWPCRCRRIVVHSLCMERVLGTQKLYGNCINCGMVIEQEEVGFRKIFEWTMPRPASDAVEDKVDFYASLGSILYFLRLGFVWMRKDWQEMKMWMAGHAYWIYWTNFILLSLAFGSMTYLVADNWYAANSQYRFKDRSSVSDTKSVISKRSRTSVISGGATDGERTEMKTARSIRRHVVE